MNTPTYVFAAAAFSGMAITKTLAIAAVVTTVSAFDAGEAHAVCGYGPTSGLWVNADRSTREITRLRIHGNCRSSAGAFPQIELWGKCQPSDCAWGIVDAEQMPIGSMENLVAQYDQGFATRRVVVRMRGTRMQLILTSTFRDGRPMRKTSSWFNLADS